MATLRNIRYIVIHCTATPSNTTVESIKRYCKEVRGWGDTPGYHYLIDSNGNVINLLDESKNSNGVYAHNSQCINISYIGGIDKDGRPKDTRSLKQQEAMYNLIVELHRRYTQAEILGHRDFPGVKKACPSFDVTTWLATYPGNH